MKPTLKQRWKRFISWIKFIPQWIDNYKLVKKYPFLQPSAGWGTNMCYHRAGYRYYYEETWLDNVPAGWTDLALELCDKLKQIIEEDHITDYVIHQVKEKWGELCWYYEGGNERIRQVTMEYESKSRNVCIRCGKTPTKYFTRGGWLTYICEDCAKKFYGDHPSQLQLKKEYT